MLDAVAVERNGYSLEIDDAGVSWLVARGGHRFRPLEPGPLFDLLLELEFEHKYGTYIVVPFESGRSAPDFDYAAYRQSPPWQRRVREVKKRDDWQCQDCGARGVPFEVHHLHYENIGNEPLEDLVLLCAVCHKQRHTFVREKSPLPAADIGLDRDKAITHFTDRYLPF